METSPSFNSSDTAETIKNTARPAVERVASGAHQAVDSIANAANEAVDTLSEKSGKLRDVQSRFVNACTGYVQENPMTSIGIALVAGFLLSRLVSGGDSR